MGRETDNPFEIIKTGSFDHPLNTPRHRAAVSIVTHVDHPALYQVRGQVWDKLSFVLRLVNLEQEILRGIERVTRT